jgi:dienelactone hydrolase
MRSDLRLSGQREPLGLWRHRAGPPLELPDLRAERIEFSSRGDRVTGRLWIPRRNDGGQALILLQHRAAASASDPEIVAVAARLAERGAVVAAVDLPLHGARADAKLGARLARALAGERGAAPEALLEEFARQAVVDLERALDALTPLPEIDAERVGFVGFGLGAQLGAAFCSLDLRVRAVALVFEAAGRTAPGFAAQECVPGIAPRPLLELREPEGPARGAASPDPGILSATLQFLVSHLGLRAA